MDQVRVFLLDDHELMRCGVRGLLEKEPGIEVVGEAASVASAIPMILALRPDVAILDNRLPDGTGVDVCRAIRARDPGIRTLMLTSYDDEESVVDAILAGASGYLHKATCVADLVAAVRHVAAGRSLLDPAATARVLDRIRFGVRQPTELDRLSVREREILGLIADGLTNRQIAHRMHLAEKTVKTYVSSVLAKLGLRSRTQAAVLATRLLADVVSGPPQQVAAAG